MASPYLPTEQAVAQSSPEVLGIERQRKLADLLTAQGFNQPQGQMISGHYVAPSWTQQLAPMANILAGTAISERADVKQQELANALRGKQKEAVDAFTSAKTTKEKFAAATSEYAPSWLKAVGAEMLKTQKVGEGESVGSMNLETGQFEPIFKGKDKYHAPTSVDMGTLGTMLIYPDGRREMVQKGREAPAGQVVETANGPMLINTRTGAAQPIMVNGQPVAPKLTTEQNKDITAINQQKATINGALDAVKQNKDAFSFSRGAAQNMPFGETLAGRFDKPEQAQARAYVFNNVSAVIKERAGTAQSPSELQRINSFMPAVTDNAQQIENKLKGFNQYLSDLEKGTRVNPNVVSSPMAQPKEAPKALNFDPALLQYMTPEQRQLFGK